jgi:hypothetical protein
MIRYNLSWLLLAGALVVSPVSQGIGHPLGTASAGEAGVIAVQGWPGQPGWGPDPVRAEHCGRLRSVAHEMRQRLHYAPPWEREPLERNLWEVRERFRDDCRGW